MTSWLRRNPIFIGVLAGVLTAGLLAYADVKTNPATGGGVTSSATTSGCTASTLLWVDSGGLVQCGATATATAVTSLRVADGTAATPSYAFTGNTGFHASGASFVELAVGGTDTWFSSTVQFQIASGSNYGWSSGSVQSSSDTVLRRVSAGVFAVADTAGGTTGGWFSNFNGEAALAANYTNATATLSATNLSYTVISGRHYNFDVEIHFTQSTAAEGVQIAFDGGSAAATDFIADCNITNTGGAIAMTNSFSTALATVINAGTTVVTTQSGLHCHGMFTPSGAGTFILRAAESGAHVSGTLTFLKGSSLVMRDTKVL